MSGCQLTPVVWYAVRTTQQESFTSFLPKMFHNPLKKMIDFPVGWPAAAFDTTLVQFSLRHSTFNSNCVCACIRVCMCACGGGCRVCTPHWLSLHSRCSICHLVRTDWWFWDSSMSVWQKNTLFLPNTLPRNNVKEFNDTTHNYKIITNSQKEPCAVLGISCP